MADLSKYKKTATTTNTVQPVRPLDLSKYKKQEPTFLQDVAGSILNAPSKVSESAISGVIAGIKTPINKIRGQDTSFAEEYKKASQLNKGSVESAKRKLTGLPTNQAKSLKDLAGATLESAATGGSFAVGGGTIGSLAKGGITQLAKLASQGVATGFTRGIGTAMQEDKNLKDTLISGGKQALIEGTLNPIGGYAGEKVIGGLSKVATKISPQVAKQTLPTMFNTAINKSQKYLDDVLDNISQPNFSSSKVRNTIDYVRAQFPNLQEEIAVRSGQPIKTVKDGNRFKFQTANQADIIKNKAIQESQEASKLASKFDDQYKISKQDVINEIDSVLSQAKGIDVASLRQEMLKKIKNDFITPNIKPSKAELLRKQANVSTSKFDEAGNLVGESDADSLISEVYKNVLSKTIADPQYQTSLRNSADNFQLAKLLNTLHNKTATAERGTFSKMITKAGQGIETTGKIIPANFGSPVEYFGKFIKAIPEINSSERALISKGVEKIVNRAKQVGAQITDNEQRVLNFVKRLEQSNKTGVPIQINVDDISALKGLESVKKYEEAIKLFNKRFGEEVLVPDDNFGIDLVKYYDRMQGATSKQKADITAELYKEILQGNKASTKTVLPANKPQEIKFDSSFVPKPTSGKVLDNTAPVIEEAKTMPKVNAQKSSLPKGISVTDAYSKDYLGFNLKGIEKQAKEKGYNLYDAMVKKVDAQETVKGKVEAMQDILDEIANIKPASGKMSGFAQITKDIPEGIGSVPDYAKDEIGTKIAQDLFPSFDVVDADSSTFQIRKEGIGSLSGQFDKEGNITKLSVEKFGERSKLFSGKNLEKRVNEYLGISTPKLNIPDSLQPLAEEAKKYKSAEEFVKAQGDYFHGTSNKIEGKLGDKTKGIWLAEDPNIANKYIGDGILGTKGEVYYVKPTSKLNIKDIYQKGDFSNFKELTPELETKLIKEGYDGIRLNDAVRYEKDMGSGAYWDKSYHPSIRIFGNSKNKLQSLTKSQLEDIWKKANAGSKVDPLIAEASKYKTAEQFVKAQGKPVYHGTDVANIIEKEGFKKMPIKTGVSAFGEGSYFTNKIGDAKGYGDVVKAFLQKDIKLKKVFDSDAYKIDTQKLIKDGYDGTILETGNGNNIVIFDTAKIKTKQQLIDIWNKANGKN